VALPEKQTKAKRAGSMAQVVECLPSKLKALGSNTSIMKEKKVFFSFS
jgi:hypothetical protein